MPMNQRVSRYSLSAILGAAGLILVFLALSNAGAASNDTFLAVILCLFVGICLIWLAAVTALTKPSSGEEWVTESSLRPKESPKEAVQRDITNTALSARINSAAATIGYPSGVVDPRINPKPEEKRYE